MHTRSSRRDAMRRPVALPAYAWAVQGARPDVGAPLRIGAQSYSFRQFSFEDSIKCMKDLGVNYMEYCAVHFPPNPDDANLPAVQRKLQSEGVEVPCYGVEGFSDDAAANRKKFEFAKLLGLEVLTADPSPDAFDDLDDLTEEFGVQVAIHNHGPGARYDRFEDTLRAVKGHSPMIGACVDTGHAIRSGEQPHEVIEQLGDRVISIHIKDWKRGGEEQIIGQGDLNLVAVVRALKAIRFTGPIMIEYENSPENPVPEMKIGLANWRAACDAA